MTLAPPVNARHMAALQGVRHALEEIFTPELVAEFHVTLYTPEALTLEFLQGGAMTSNSELYTLQWVRPDGTRNVAALRADWPGRGRCRSLPEIALYRSVTDASGALTGYAPGAYDVTEDPSVLDFRSFLRYLLRTT